VIFFEPKALYRAYREEVPEAEEVLPIGVSQVAREGNDLTIVTYGAMLRPVLAAAEKLQQQTGAAAEVIDLQTIAPLDDNLFVASVRRTGRAMIVHEAPRSFGAGAEVVSRLVEKAFYYLEQPIVRVTGYDVIIPLFAREKSYLPNADRVLRAARRMLAT
jgi:pyruvate dehydrogenase E1 component beta subunit